MPGEVSKTRSTAAASSALSGRRLWDSGAALRAMRAIQPSSAPLAHAVGVGGTGRVALGVGSVRRAGGSDAAFVRTGWAAGGHHDPGSDRQPALPVLGAQGCPPGWHGRPRTAGRAWKIHLRDLDPALMGHLLRPRRRSSL